MGTVFIVRSLAGQVERAGDWLKNGGGGGGGETDEVRSPTAWGQATFRWILSPRGSVATASIPREADSGAMPTVAQGRPLENILHFTLLSRVPGA